jgi:hypothetical protein
MSNEVEVGVAMSDLYSCNYFEQYYGLPYSLINTSFALTFRVFHTFVEILSIGVSLSQENLQNTEMKLPNVLLSNIKQSLINLSDWRSCEVRGGAVGTHERQHTPLFSITLTPIFFVTFIVVLTFVSPFCSANHSCL